MRVSIAITAALLLTGCNHPAPRLNAPPHGEAEKVAESAGTLMYMSDNALLEDMSLSDMHFIPHRPMLSAFGIERLTRMASLLSCYGGNVRLITRETDTALIDQRIRSVRDFLEEASIDLQATQIVCDLPGGHGMNATESIQILKNEGTYKPNSGGQSSAANAPKTTTP
jgi:hypothetical protein